VALIIDHDNRPELVNSGNINIAWIRYDVTRYPKRVQALLDKPEWRSRAWLDQLYHELHNALEAGELTVNDCREVLAFYHNEILQAASHEVIPVR